MTLKERYTSTLHGCAYGDTIGMAVEGWKRGQIKKYIGRVTEPLAPIIVRDAAGTEISEDEFGKLKYWTRGLQKGEWTDDTIFTAAIAASIAEKKSLDLEDVACRHLKLYRELPASAYGKTTRDALENLAKGISPQRSGVIGGPGNGPAMKMSPLGLYMHATGEYDKGIRFAEDVGLMTHIDPRSVVSGAIQAYAVCHLLNDASRDEFMNALIHIASITEFPVMEGVHTWAKKGDITSRLRWIADNKDVDADTAHITLGSSSAVYQSYP